MPRGAGIGRPRRAPGLRNLLLFLVCAAAGAPTGSGAPPGPAAVAAAAAAHRSAACAGPAAPEALCGTSAAAATAAATGSRRALIEIPSGCPKPVVAPQPISRTWVKNATFGEAFMAGEVYGPAAGAAFIKALLRNNCNEKKEFKRCRAPTSAKTHIVCPPASQPHSRFVTRSDAGPGLCLDGRRFLFVGANIYNLLDLALMPSQRPQVEAVMDAAVSMGLKVVRMWGFVWSAALPTLQTGPDTFDERTFAAFDYVIAAAAARGLKLIIAFSTYWDDAAESLRMILTWCPDVDTNVDRCDVPALKDQLYHSADCRRVYAARMRAIANRFNPIRGLKYRDEPTIMMWNIMNEPRAHGKLAGSAGTGAICNWMRAMAAELRSADPNHLISEGSEGFYGGTAWPDAGRGWANPGPWGRTEGQGFIRDGRLKELDVLTLHAWPSNWFDETWMGQFNRTMPAANRLIFLKNWLTTHLLDAADLGKPLVLEEFNAQGTGVAGVELRNMVFGLAFATIEENARHHGPAAGSAFWHLELEPPPAAPGAPPVEREIAAVWPSDESTVALVRMHSAALQLIRDEVLAQVH